MMNLYDIQKASNGQLYGQPVAHLFNKFVLDASEAAPGTLFVALRLGLGDTHHQIEAAIHNGASGVLCHQPPECDTTGVSVLMVKDSLDALLAWSGFVIGRYGAKVIAIGGSTGKSIAAEAIAAVLGTRYSVHRGDVDSDGRLAIPRSILDLKPEQKFIILKLTTSEPGEMARMVQATHPEVAVINHIANLPHEPFADLPTYLAEQTLLLETLSPIGHAILNMDDAHVRTLSARTRASVHTLGIDEFSADLLAYNVQVGSDRLGFDVRYEGQRYPNHWSPLLGQHVLYELLAALLVGVQYGVPLQDGLAALQKLRPLPGRMNPLAGIGYATLIDDTYRANVDSTLDALAWLGSVRADFSRRLLLLGDLDRLADGGQAGLREIGARAAQVADVLITLGIEAAQVARAALDYGLPTRDVHVCYTPADALGALARYQPSADDVLLIKGGTGIRAEGLVRALLMHPDDHKQLVRQAPIEYAERPRPLRPSWVEINAQTLANNVRLIRQHLPESSTLMAVVKANGYGHGAVTVARVALANGAEALAVANIAEAIELREAGIEVPILILSYMPAYAVRQAIALKLAVAVFDLDLVGEYDRAARQTNGKLAVHVKVDSGMGRLGVATSDLVPFFRHLSAMEGLEVEGIFTHFSSADADPTYTQQQVERFKAAFLPIRAAGIKPRFIHASNSAGSLLPHDPLFNMVRVGVMLYGLHPSQVRELPAGIEPVMSWKTSVLQVRTLPAHHPVGYGNTYITQASERIAILPVGYADGFRRHPHAWREVLIHGQRAPLIGRVSMEKAAVSVQHIPNVSIGDEVVLLGAQEGQRIYAEDIAAWLGTSNYEVVTNILPRLPRA